MLPLPPPSPTQRLEPPSRLQGPEPCSERLHKTTAFFYRQKLQNLRFCNSWLGMRPSDSHIDRLVDLREFNLETVHLGKVVQVLLQAGRRRLQVTAKVHCRHVWRNDVVVTTTADEVELIRAGKDLLEGLAAMAAFGISSCSSCDWLNLLTPSSCISDVVQKVATVRYYCIPYEVSQTREVAVWPFIWIAGAAVRVQYMCVYTCCIVHACEQDKIRCVQREAFNILWCTCSNISVKSLRGMPHFWKTYTIHGDRERL